MFRRLLGNILLNLGYIPREDYNAAIYDGIKLQQNLANLAKKSQDLEKLNTQLSGEVKALLEENNSLWDMLDEMKDSSSFGTAQMESTMENIKDMLTDEMLKDFKPIGEA
jgi:uncharacterized protein (DUF3084 family)